MIAADTYRAARCFNTTLQAAFDYKWAKGGRVRAMLRSAIHQGSFARDIRDGSLVVPSEP